MLNDGSNAVKTPSLNNLVDFTQKDVGIEPSPNVSSGVQGLKGYYEVLDKAVIELNACGITHDVIARRIKESAGGKALEDWKLEDPSLWDFDDILRDKPELALTIDQDGKNFLEMGDIIAIIGKSKTKKSFISLQLALCVSAGIPLWDKFSVPKPNDVLLFQAEVKAGYYNERLIRMTDGLGVSRQEVGKHLSIVNARGFTGGLDQFTSRMLEHGKGKALIVIDPLYTLIQEDENKATAYIPVWEAFREISEQTGAAVAFIHHDAKGISGDRELQDRGAGHSSIGRFYDTGIFIDRHKDDTRETPLTVLDFMCRNSREPESFTLQFDPARLMFIPSDKLADKRTSKTAKSGKPKLLKPMLDALVERIHQHAREHPLGKYLKQYELRDWLRAEFGATDADARQVVDGMGKGDPRIEYISAGPKSHYIPRLSDDEQVSNL